MAGHSKWKNIMHKKSKTDAKRGKEFTKLGRELMVAVKEGGPDPELNSRLKDVIAKCKAANMPNDNIKRSIEKAAGSADGDNFEEITYEGYGPEGVAIMVETATDNRNRTAGDIRHIFDKFNGNLGTSGCVSFMFSKKGVIIIERKDDMDEETLMLTAIDAGAEDFTAEEEYFEIVTSPEDFSATREALAGLKLEFAEAQIEWVPASTTVLKDSENKVRMEKLIERLEDNDDVQNVWHNWDQDS